MNWANQQYEFEKWAVPASKGQAFVVLGQGRWRGEAEKRGKSEYIRVSQTFLPALSSAFPGTHLSPPLAPAPPPLCWAISQPSKITKEKKN